MVVEIRRGRWDRGYRELQSADQIVDAQIHGESGLKPWMAEWNPATPWMELEGVQACTIQQSFDQNGQTVATLTMDNTRLKEMTGPGGQYHTFERGYLSPDRGFVAVNRGQAGGPATEWEGVLARKSQVRIWQGYGPPQREEEEDEHGSTMPPDGGTNGGWVFVGQIDDLDLDSSPDAATITCRTGHPLTDERLFGWNKSKQLKDPITFAPADPPGDEEPNNMHILVEDVADMVRVVLRWAGYQEWWVEDTGFPLKGPVTFNRATYLIDIIRWVVDQTGYSFYMQRPSGGDSLGIPTLRYNSARLSASEWEDAYAPEYPREIEEITDWDLLTDVSEKQSDEPLAYIIRVRGKDDRGGVPLGGDSTRRLMAVYRPPWSYRLDEESPDRLGGLIRHVVHTDPNLKTIDECEVKARLIALGEVLASVQVSVQFAGHYAFNVDDQVSIIDMSPAIDSRLWIAAWSSEFTQRNPETTWTTTLTGALLDTYDVQALLEEMEEFQASSAARNATTGEIIVTEPPPGGTAGPDGSEAVAGEELFFEDFDTYAENSPFNPAHFRHNPTNDDYASECPSRAENAYHDGDTHLVLRVKHEPGGVLNNESPQVEKDWSGIQLASFGYGLGRPEPESENRLVWKPPFRYEVRYKMPSLEAGYIIASWLQTANRGGTEYIHELDVGENTPTLEGSSRNYQHRWLAGRDTRNQTIGTQSGLSDWRSNYHVVRADVLVEGPRYYVDDILVGTGGALTLVDGSPDTEGRFGVILQNILSPSPPLSSFFGGGGVAPSSGEYLTLIDWIRVTAL